MHFYVAGEVECTLKDILSFSSGSHKQLDLLKHLPYHSYMLRLPTASTCDITLRLPTTPEEYGQFKQYLLLGVQGHDGLGVFDFSMNCWT